MAIRYVRGREESFENVAGVTWRWKVGAGRWVSGWTWGRGIYIREIKRSKVNEWFCAVDGRVHYRLDDRTS